MDEKKLPPFLPPADAAALGPDLRRAADLLDEVVPGRGKELVVQLARGFCGTYVYFPQKDKLFREARDRWIIEQYDAGFRVPDIARRVDLCERQVWYILGREPGEEKQLRLW